MSDELKNGDRVRYGLGPGGLTGVYIGRSPDPFYPLVVMRDNDKDLGCYPAGAWERIPDEVTITIPRTVALNYATGAFAADDHFAMRDICREALPDWDGES